MLVFEPAANLGDGWLPDVVGFEEGFKNELQDIGGRLMPCRDVSHAVHERGRSGMMRQLIEEGGLPNAGLATDFDGKAGIDRRQRISQFLPAIQKAASQPRPLKDWRGAGTKRVFGRRRFLEDPAEWLADVKNVATDEDLTSD